MYVYLYFCRTSTRQYLEAQVVLSMSGHSCVLIVLIVMIVMIVIIVIIVCEGPDYFVDSYSSLINNN